MPEQYAKYMISLKRLFLMHAIITLAAGIVLIVSPAFIPATVDMVISPQQSLLCYFLGAAEIALAYLSFMGSRISDVKSLRMICMTFIIFHGLTALVELLSYTEGINKNILANVLARLMIVGLFMWLGIHKLKPHQNSDQHEHQNN
jgi:phosphate starvation-inducible membrane PsiE